ncbi:MAG: hypothetical protein VX796_16430 [Pseudomonadota bacterium]|nr:hypothetical protein [Pseudomonadota bacterium]
MNIDFSCNLGNDPAYIELSMYEDVDAYPARVSVGVFVEPNDSRAENARQAKAKAIETLEAALAELKASPQ